MTVPTTIPTRLPRIGRRSKQQFIPTKMPTLHPDINATATQNVFTCNWQIKIIFYNRLETFFPSLFVVTTVHIRFESLFVMCDLIYVPIVTYFCVERMPCIVSFSNVCVVFHQF